VSYRLLHSLWDDIFNNATFPPQAQKVISGDLACSHWPSSCPLTAEKVPLLQSCPVHWSTRTGHGDHNTDLRDTQNSALLSTRLERWLQNSCLNVFNVNDFRLRLCKVVPATKHRAINAYRRTGGKAPSILNLISRLMWETKFKLWPLYLQRKSSLYSLYRRLGEVNSRADNWRREKPLFLPRLEPVRPSPSPVTLPTQLPRFMSFHNKFDLLITVNTKCALCILQATTEQEFVFSCMKVVNMWISCTFNIRKLFSILPCYGYLGLFPWA
jgi:hypothetical protein